MANLSSEQEDLLKEIKSTFGGDTDIEASEASSQNPENADDPVNTEEASSQDSEDNIDNIDDLENMDTSQNESPNKSMPKYGPGFKYVPIISAVTVVAVILGHLGPIAGGVFITRALRYIYIGLGIALIAWGISLLLNAVNESAILLNAQMGKLVTTGIYSKTRNPMYTGVTFICTGVLFISGNVYMFFLPILYWLFMSSLMTNTEEDLLERNFGQDYLDYKNETYRFMPFKKKL